MKTENEKDPYGHKVSVNGSEIYYKKVGNGDHVVLLMPGDWGSSDDFMPQLEGMDEEKFTLIAWDPPGYGLSRPPDRDFKDFLQKDAEAAAELMKVLGIDKYSIMGWSAGGITGIILSAKYPDNVNKLVIWGVKVQNTEQNTDEDVREYNHLTQKMSVWTSKIRQNYFNVWNDELFNKIRTLYTDCSVAYDEFSKDDVKRIKCPTFLLRGDKDPYVSIEQSDYFVNNIKNVRFHPFPDGAHDFHQKYANEFNTLVQEFLLQK